MRLIDCTARPIEKNDRKIGLMAIERAGKPLTRSESADNKKNSATPDRGGPFTVETMVDAGPPPAATQPANRRRAQPPNRRARLPPRSNLHIRPRHAPHRRPPPQQRRVMSSRRIVGASAVGRGRAGSRGRATDRTQCCATAAAQRSAPYGSRMPAAPCACHDATVRDVALENAF